MWEERRQSVRQGIDFLWDLILLQGGIELSLFTIILEREVRGVVLKIIDDIETGTCAARGKKACCWRLRERKVAAVEDETKEKVDVEDELRERRGKQAKTKI